MQKTNYTKKDILKLIGASGAWFGIAVAVGLALRHLSHFFIMILWG